MISNYWDDNLSNNYVGILGIFTGINQSWPTRSNILLIINQHGKLAQPLQFNLGHPHPLAAI